MRSSHRPGWLLSAALLAALLAALTVAGSASTAHADPVPRPTPRWVEEFRIADNRITESSGLYASQLHPGIVWTHNDGQGVPTLYAVGPDGTTKATITIEGVPVTDTEAMGGAVDSRGNVMLYLADIGDNTKTRTKGVTLLVIPEPKVLSSAKVRAQRYQLVYPNGPQDAETLLVHPQTGNIYIVTKSPSGGAIYAAPTALVSDVMNRLEYLSPVPYVVSDGAINANGQMFLRGYNMIRVFGDVAGQPLETIPAPKQPQGESLAISADGRSMLAGSEGKGSAVFRLPLSKELAAAPLRKPGRQPDVPVEDQPSSVTRSTYPTGWIAGGMALLAAALFGMVRLARRRSIHDNSEGVVALASRHEG